MSDSIQGPFIVTGASGQLGGPMVGPGWPRISIRCVGHKVPALPTQAFEDTNCLYRQIAELLAQPRIVVTLG